MKKRIKKKIKKLKKSINKINKVRVQKGRKAMLQENMGNCDLWII